MNNVNNQNSPTCPICNAIIESNQLYFCQNCGYDFNAQQNQDEIDEGFDSGFGFSEHNQNTSYNPQNIDQHRTIKNKTNHTSHYDNEPPKPLKSRTLAGVLGILFGFLGVHHFYVGYTGRGIFLLLMTIIIFRVFIFLPIAYLIPVIWGIVEGILILMGKLAVTDPYGRPLE